MVRFPPQNRTIRFAPPLCEFPSNDADISEKPRMRLGCPSRSTFSQAPRKLISCGFWQKRVRLSDLLEGGLTVLQEPTLTVLLVLPNIVILSVADLYRDGSSP